MVDLQKYDFELPKYPDSRSFMETVEVRFSTGNVTKTVCFDREAFNKAVELFYKTYESRIKDLKERVRVDFGISPSPQFDLDFYESLKYYKPYLALE